MLSRRYRIPLLVNGAFPDRGRDRASICSFVSGARSAIRQARLILAWLRDGVEQACERPASPCLNIRASVTFSGLPEGEVEGNAAVKASIRRGEYEFGLLKVEL